MMYDWLALGPQVNINIAGPFRATIFVSGGHLCDCNVVIMYVLFRCSNKMCS